MQELVLYRDKTYIRVNNEGDQLFYFFDYDVRTAEVNMEFQHFHSFYEVAVMLCPKSTHFIEGKPYELQALDICCIPPNVLHKTRYPEGSPCKRVIIQFSLPQRATGLGDEFQELLSVFRQETPIFRFEVSLQQKIFRKLNEIFIISEKTDPMRDLSIHLIFLEFLTLIYVNREQNRYYNKSGNYPMEDKIYSIASYIHTHYSEELSLKELSQRFYVSSCYLSHQFKNVTGFTLTDYIHMTRLRNIQSMLINTNVPIADAAIACGFSSFSQFNRVFQKHIGMSPSQYRKQTRPVADTAR